MDMNVNDLLAVELKEINNWVNMKAEWREKLKNNTKMSRLDDLKENQASNNKKEIQKKKGIWKEIMSWF